MDRPAGIRWKWTHSVISGCSQRKTKLERSLIMFKVSIDESDDFVVVRGGRGGHARLYNVTTFLVLVLELDEEDENWGILYFYI